MKSFKLNNGVELPCLSIGTNRMDRDKLLYVVNGALDAGINFFDTARDYGNESIVGDVLKELRNARRLDREDIYITTKVGNSQQISHNLYEEIDQSLRNLQSDYIDLWLLHWPYPNFYIANFKQMVEICKSGKVRAIGLANAKIRHIQPLIEEGVVPQVIQIEHHPFRQSNDIMEYCSLHQIQVEAYSPLCFMIPKLRNNPVLHEIARKHNKTLGQVVLRWHHQTHVIPVFRSESPNRFVENTNIFDFELDQFDMDAIGALDEDFKFIPESLHCPGF